MITPAFEKYVFNVAYYSISQDEVAANLSLALPCIPEAGSNILDPRFIDKSVVVLHHRLTANWGDYDKATHTRSVTTVFLANNYTELDKLIGSTVEDSRCKLQTVLSNYLVRVKSQPLGRRINIYLNTSV